AGNFILPHFLGDIKSNKAFSRTHIEKKRLCGHMEVSGKKVKLFNHIVDPVHPKADAHTRNTGNPKQSCEIVIPAAATNTSHFYRSRSLCFKNSSCIII